MSACMNTCNNKAPECENKKWINNCSENTISLGDKSKYHENDFDISARPISQESIRIFDRTILEIFNRNQKADSLELQKLCFMLKKIGSDIFEASVELIEKLGMVDAEVKFVVHIKNYSHGQVCISKKVWGCIIGVDMLNEYNILEELKSNEIKIILEYSIDSFEDLQGIYKLKYLEAMRFISCVRLRGLDSIYTAPWVYEVVRLRSLLKKEIVIYPGDDCYGAVQIALDSIFNKMDGITASFSGLGIEKNYAALEEVVIAAKVINGAHLSEGLKKMQRIKQLFEKLSGVKILDDKAILGSGIFHYESGIHADGIDKDPSTYEPFSPEMIGLERKLHLGKHSGRGAVLLKLKEFGLSHLDSNADTILEKVRNESIKLGRSLKDHEFIELCGG